ncbi:MAG: exonuclease subunit SbcD [Clostridia bacterium]|nr:exonuclease subunit SbcD [Clostridia bacterium]
MKFLHLADLHIGKRLEGRYRLDEQREVLKEITDIAKRENVDLTLIAGDVFDVTSPTAEAKRIFYRFALDLASVCPVIAISGNHDGPAELSSPKDLAEIADIRLIGKSERITLDLGEKVNISALPYPDDASLREYEGEYVDKVKSYISDSVTNFVDGETNILLAHLFMTGGSEGSDENTLGPARMLPKTVLPEATYVALGHVHKPMTASKSKRAYYAGSPMAYHFDDEGEKSVIIGNAQKGKLLDLHRVPLTVGRRLVTVSVTTFDECVKALSENEGNLVKIKYHSREPLSMSEIKTLKAHECFVKLEVITAEKESDEKIESVKPRTDTELFEAYYEKTYAEKPTDEIVSLFADILSEAKEGK